MSLAQSFSGEETHELTRLSSGRTVKRRKWDMDVADKDEDYGE